MFRYKRSIKVPYAEQGYIYFLSRRYRSLPPEKRQAIREATAVVSPEYRAALLQFVTTDMGIIKCCEKHHMSESTLHRAVNKYYSYMAQLLKAGQI